MAVKERHGASSKVAYGRWLYGRALLDELRGEHSWTQISLLVKGHGDSPGWAASSYQHRHLMGERDISKMEELLTQPSANGAGNKVKDQRIPPDQRKKYLDLLSQLREKYGWSMSEIAQALGYKDQTTVYGAIRGGGTGMVSKLTKAQHIIDGLEKEAKLLEEKKQEKLDSANEIDTTQAERKLKEHLEGSAACLLTMSEGAPPFKKAGIEEAIQRLSGLMEFLGL